MNIYRIFNALGDSIILCTYINTYKPETIYYNRAELSMLEMMMDLYGITPPKFMRIEQRTPETMVDVLSKLKEDNIKLMNLPIERKQLGYNTVQLMSKNESAKDRSTTLDEASVYIKDKAADIKDVSSMPNIQIMLETLAGSKQHVSIDSGTAWAAASLGIDTTVISKNSYYFADAYHYMKYIQTQDNVKVHQQDSPGVFMANEIQFYKYSNLNNVEAGSYEQYKRRALRI